ncbi:hypothetical protein BGZ83_007965 [Gryganskiella cystojenkinii]|nr:hypothetical protein BGZ83_007965 [Gryganskiella cystojenkinii]
MRRTMSMGHFVPRPYERSLSRPKRRRYNSSSDSGDAWGSESDEAQFTDWSTSSRKKSRSRSRPERRPSKRRRNRAPSSSSDMHSSEESENSALESDVPLSKLKEKTNAATEKATSQSDPATRLQGPIKEMMTEMDRLTSKCVTRMTKLERTFKKLYRTQSLLKNEIRELNKEVGSSASRMNNTTLATMLSPSSGQNTTPSATRRAPPAASSPLSIGGGLSTFDPSRVPTYTPTPVQPVLVNAPPVHVPSPAQPATVPVYRPNDRAAPAPVTTPPSTEIVQVIEAPKRTISLTEGYKRVFEAVGPSVPLSSQQAMTALVTGGHNVFAGAFGRRPRAMVLNPFSHQTAFDGIAAASDMDGYIHFWDINTQRLLVKYKPSYHRVIPYPEAITWVGENALIAISHLKKEKTWPAPPDATEPQLEPTLMSLPESQTTLITLSWDSQGELQATCVAITSAAHTRTINAVTAARLSDNVTSYITGGKDKSLVIWRLNVNEDLDPAHAYSAIGLIELHQHHIAPISSIMYSHQTKTLFSGGAGGQYLSYDIDTNSVLKNFKFQNRKTDVFHILECPTDPNINLVVTSQNSEQYQLMDHRLPNPVVQVLSYPTTQNISKLAVPSWHPDGGLVLTGTKEGEGMLNIWDVRWNKITNGIRPGGYHTTTAAHLQNRYNSHLENTQKRYSGLPTQSLSLGGQRLVQALFHPTQSVMMTLNSDCSFAFWDYTLQQHNFGQ